MMGRLAFFARYCVDFRFGLYSAAAAADGVTYDVRSYGEWNVMPRIERALVAAEITPRSGKEQEAARALQTMGFRVHAVGATISVDAPRKLWKAAFGARFAPARREKRPPAGAETSTPRVSPVAFQVPAALEPLVERVVFVELPELF